VLTRRDFLRSSPLVALAPTVPSFLAQTGSAARPERHGRVLVVVQLTGGNDGINTLVPFKDEGYAKWRKKLRHATASLVKINREVGLPPALRPLAGLLEAGHLSIVQGVGYPNPSGSHFESMSIWHTARRDPRDHDGFGWLGRTFDAEAARGRAAPGVPMVFVGADQMPPALRSRRSVASGLARPEDFLLDPQSRMKLTPPPAEATDLLAFVTRMAVDGPATARRMRALVGEARGGPSYPSTELAKQLKLTARLIKLDLGTRVFYLRQRGYDTHASQAAVHFGLLETLATGLKAFLDDLTAAKVTGRVAVLCFSEFGRTVRENGSEGTDHGTAGPVLLAGAGVKGGLTGQTPSLVDLDPRSNELKVSLDFRRVYAAVLEDWLRLPSEQALGGKFEPLDLFRKT
jgi:uncharacterized protein (DUF1501 family)